MRQRATTARPSQRWTSDAVYQLRAACCGVEGDLSSAIAHPAAPGESLGTPVWVMTILVWPPMSSSSTRTSVVVGCPSGMPASGGDSTPGVDTLTEGSPLGRPEPVFDGPRRVPATCPIGRVLAPTPAHER